MDNYLKQVSLSQALWAEEHVLIPDLSDRESRHRILL